MIIPSYIGKQSRGCWNSPAPDMTIIRIRSCETIFLVKTSLSVISFRTHLNVKNVLPVWVQHINGNARLGQERENENDEREFRI